MQTFHNNNNWKPCTCIITLHSSVFVHAHLHLHVHVHTKMYIFIIIIIIIIIIKEWYYMYNNEERALNVKDIFANK